MTIMRVATRQGPIDHAAIARHILQGGEVKGSNVSGEATGYGNISQWLNGEAEATLIQHNVSNSIEYVLRSYATPIGWIAEDSEGNRTFYLVDGRMSPSITGHQSFVRRVAEASCLPIVYLSNAHR